MPNFLAQSSSQVKRLLPPRTIKRRPLWRRSSSVSPLSFPSHSVSFPLGAVFSERSVDMAEQYMGQIRAGFGQPGPSTSTAAKRPFQDLDNGGEETRDSSPGRSSSSGSSPNKRARSEGSPSTDTGSSGSSNTLAGSSSSSSHLPIQPAAEFDVVPTEAIPDHRPPPPTLPSPTHLLTTSNHLPMLPRSPLVDLHHSSLLPVPYPSTQSTLPHPPAPSTSTNSLEADLQRAHDLELQIAAIREDISNPGASSTEHFPPTDPSRHSPTASRAPHDSDLPSVEQFLNDIHNRSPPLSSNIVQTFAARRERLLSTLSLLRRERRERQTGEREETSRTRSPPVHGYYPPDVPRSPQLPQFLQLYGHILSDHLVNSLEDDYLSVDPFYNAQASAADLEPAPLPLDLERGLAEGVFHAPTIVRNRHILSSPRGAPDHPSLGPDNSTQPSNTIPPQVITT